MISFAAPTVMDAGYVALHMREDERAQWCAITGRAEYDANDAARTFVGTAGPQWCMRDADGMPLVIGGLEPIGPGAAQAWLACGAAGWDAHWRPLTRFCRRLVDGLLRDGTLRRVQVVALTTRPGAHEWYGRALGFKHEGILDSYFTDGRDGVMFARTRKHVERRA